MKLRCMANELTIEQENRLKEINDYYRKEEHPIDIGKEYLAYALWFRKGEPFVDIYWEVGYVISEPLFLFEVIDNRVSKYWKYEAQNDFIFLQPELFYTEYFFDDLSEGIPEVVEKFTTLKKLMDEEFAE